MTRIRCPSCDTEHDRGAYRCEQCGKDLVDVDSPSTASQEVRPR